MRSALRHGSIMLGLAGAAGLVISHLAGPAADATAKSAAPAHLGEMTASIGHAATSGQISLTDKQLGLTFLGVEALHSVPEVVLPVREAALPGSIKLQNLPAMVTRKVPELHDFKFVKLDDWILVVRPSDRAVVAEIPRYRFVP